MRDRYLLTAFVTIALGALVNRNLGGWTWLNYWLVPGAMPFLLVYAWRGTRSGYSVFRSSFIGAIGLGIIIDAFSMFAVQSNVVLVGYTLVNILYIVTFMSEIRQYKRPLYFQNLWWFGPFLLGIMWVALQMLWPNISCFRLLIALFSFSFVLLVVFAVSRLNAVSDASFFAVSIGCILLCLSNCIGGVIWFVTPLPFGLLFNNATYFAAQFYIITGVVQQVGLRHPNQTKPY